MPACADRPLRLETRHSRDRLGRRPREDDRILNRLPALIVNFRDHCRDWKARNLRRNRGRNRFGS